MADQEVSDLFLKIEVDPNSYLGGGETQTEFARSRGDLASDFDRYNTLQLQSFTMRTGIGGDEVGEADAKNDKNLHKMDKMAEFLRQSGGPDIGKFTRGRTGYAKFLGKDNWDKAKYPVDLKPIQFTRTIDRASGALLQHCIKRKVLTSATLIKRKSAGGDVSGEVFLRFDFHKVLLINVEWEDGEPIKETVEFVCRSVTINYLPQLPNGELGAPRSADWSATGTGDGR